MNKSVIVIILMLFPFFLSAHSDEKTNDTSEFVKPEEVFTEDDDFSIKIIEMDDWSFSEDLIELNKGTKYRIIFKTVKGHHGVVFPDLKLESDNIALGEKVSFDFEFNEATEIDFLCNIPCGPGHNQMKGKLVVK